MVFATQTSLMFSQEFNDQISLPIRNYNQKNLKILKIFPKNYYIFHQHCMNFDSSATFLFCIFNRQGNFENELRR